MEKLKAELEPLHGKYYGTEIKLTNLDGGTGFFRVWINGLGDYSPSSRELVGYHKNEDSKWVDDEYPDCEYEICDDHYESAIALEVCECIVEAINRRFA